MFVYLRDLCNNKTLVLILGYFLTFTRTASMEDDETDTDMPRDDEGVYERLVSHDSAGGSVPSVDFVNRLAERHRLALLNDNNPDREYMETHPYDRVFYFEPPVGKWTLAKLMRSPYYCVVGTGVVLVFLFIGWAYPLLGMILWALSLASYTPEIYKWVRAKSQARHDQQ